MEEAFSSSEIAHLIVDFISSISNNPAEKRQVVMDKAKCRLFLSLFNTPLQSELKSQEFFLKFMVEQFKNLVNLPHCQELIFQDFFSLFDHTHDNLILQFLNEVIINYEKYIQMTPEQRENSTLSEECFQRICRLLFLIAFKFPSSIPQQLMLQLVKSEELPVSDRLFVFSGFLYLIHSKVISEDAPKYITTFFNLVVDNFQSLFR